MSDGLPGYRMQVKIPLVITTFPIHADYFHNLKVQSEYFDKNNKDDR